MMATGLCKLDNGSSYATNCFPARSILRTNKEGAGHWLVAHKSSQEKRVVKVASLYISALQPCIAVEEVTEENVLDGPFLMKLHGVKTPSDLCSVNISNKNLALVKDDDFEQFDSVAYVNATENLLTLEAFRKFPGLRELELSLNGLRHLKIQAGEFLTLELLDLSYNNLSPEDVRALGVLSQLKVLHLTANGLQSLPSDLVVSEEGGSTPPRFPSLEILLLDDNDLSHPSVFVSLANLRSLKQLNLDKNGISKVPYLHQKGNSRFSLSPDVAKMGTRAEAESRLRQWHKQRQRGGADGHKEPKEKGGQLEYFILQNSKDLDRTEVIFTSASREPPSLDVSEKGNDQSCPADSEALPAASVNTMNQDFVPPFPELRSLSLANNKIESEEDLLPAVLFPSLLELSFYGNPLSTSRSGDPPLLTSFLQCKLGIKLIRRKISKLGKLHICIPLKANRKITSHLPKVPKQLLMLEAPQESSWKLCLDTKGAQPEKSKEGSHNLSLPDLLPPIGSSSVEQNKMLPYEAKLEEPEEGSPSLSLAEEDSMIRSSFAEENEASHSAETLGSNREMPETEDWDSEVGPEGAEEDVESFFMTQVDGASGPLWRPETEERHAKRSKQGKGSRDQHIPAKYKGYEELLDAKTDPGFLEPVGIQQNIQALQHALRHPLVYRDSRPRLDSLQKPYVPRRKVGKPPGPAPRRTKAEVLEDLLVAMRWPVNITEVPLVSVLKKKTSNPKEYQEALRLVREFQKTYKAMIASSSKTLPKECRSVEGLGQSPGAGAFAEIQESKRQPWAVPAAMAKIQSLKHCPLVKGSPSTGPARVKFAA
ncbi:PREDICTED: X-ray radiation resistance-associated protein 1 [Gavialis gangeticus]|uniref:X-ray radiation resistance-associated protein 1 n=1 Tax=Gavialis gangeticus TaxID=94835 RepID=UPI00092F2317|nr:PREDICTED: X-ray radiation resistance-associated protein 1 [Gavialis gangeticus]